VEENRISFFLTLLGFLLYLSASMLLLDSALELDNMLDDILTGRLSFFYVNFLGRILS